MIKTGDSLYNWSNVTSFQSMGFSENKDGFSFVPSVTWQCDDLKFMTSVTSGGEANKNYMLDIRYAFENLSDQPLDFEFYLIFRPFQVNPTYQFLNLTGGAGRINSIKEDEGGFLTIDNKIVIPQKKYDSFGAGIFDEGTV